MEFIKKELAFLKRLAILAVVGMTLGFIVGSCHTINQLTKKVEIASKPETLKAEARNRVFRVFIQTPYGTGGGTASLVRIRGRGNVVLTNKHICEAIEGSKRDVGGAIVILEQNGKRFFTDVLAMSERTDLCVLETPADLVMDPAYEMAPIKPIKEDPVYVYGHPFLEPLTENHGNYKYEFVLPPNPGDSKYDLHGLNAARLNFYIHPGNSGSPVLNVNGELVGVVFALDDLGGLFIPLSEVERFLAGV